MWNFCQFWNAMNGEPYTNGVPPPVKYDMQDYRTQISPSGSRFNNIEGDSTYELKPIEFEDMARYANDDVIGHYAGMHGGKNPNRLGDQMSDAEFKKFYGHTW